MPNGLQNNTEEPVALLKGSHPVGGSTTNNPIHFLRCSLSMIINTQMLLQPSISLSVPHLVPLQAVLGPVPAQQLDHLHVASADLTLPAVVPNPHTVSPSEYSH